MHLSWTWYGYWCGLWYLELVTIVLKQYTCLEVVMNIYFTYLSCQYIVPKQAKDTYNIPKYEMTRLVRMKHNQERINALGLKYLSTSLKDSAQPNCANGKINRASVMT